MTLDQFQLKKRLTRKLSGEGEAKGIVAVIGLSGNAGVSGEICKESVSRIKFRVDLIITLLTFAKAIGIILIPRELGRFNARPQEFFRALQLLNGIAQETLQMPGVLRSAVGQRPFEVGPHEFIGVQFGRVSRERISPDVRMRLEKPLNQAGFVNRAAIPQQDKPFTKMPQEMSQESGHFHSADIAASEADVERNPFPPGGNTDRRNGRNLRPFTSYLKDRGLAPGRPGFSNRGNQRKPALVKKHQRHPAPLRVFLYAASCNAPNALPFSRPFLWLVFRAFDSSIPSPEGFSKRATDDTPRRNAYPPPWRFSSRSTDPWNIPALRGPSRESSSSLFSHARLTSQAVREQVLTSSPRLPFSASTHSNNKQNSRNNRSSLPLPADLNLYPAAQRLAGGAVQAVLGFHGVSWNQFAIFPLLMQTSIVPCRISANFDKASGR